MLSTLCRPISVLRLADPVIPVVEIKSMEPLKDGEARGAYELRELLNANDPSAVNKLS